MKNFFTRFKAIIARQLTAALGTLAAVSAALVLFSAKYICCFEFEVGGKSIGYSQSEDFYEVIKSEVNSEITSTFGESECITAQATVSPAIIGKSELTQRQTFFDNVAAMSDCMTPAATLVIDGESAVSFSTEAELRAALDSIIADYSGGGEAEISEELEVKNGYVSAASVVSREDGERYIRENSLINASAVVMATYTEVIAFEEQTTENADMYEGESQILQEGASGEKTVNAKIILKNGVEESREVISESITREPVAEICSVGTKPVPDGVGTGSFIFPTSGTISSHFGSRWGKVHEGLDIANSLGTAIYAADEGRVIFSGVQSGYGNIIILDHANGYTTKYAHCSELLKSVGDVVGKGDLIAKSGNTGRSTGNHVHFEICKGGEPINPLELVEQT